MPPNSGHLPSKKRKTSEDHSNSTTVTSSSNNHDATPETAAASIQTDISPETNETVKREQSITNAQQEQLINEKKEELEPALHSPEATDPQHRQQPKEAEPSSSQDQTEERSKGPSEDREATVAASAPETFTTVPVDNLCPVLPLPSTPTCALATDTAVAAPSTATISECATKEPPKGSSSSSNTGHPTSTTTTTTSTTHLGLSVPLPLSDGPASSSATDVADPSGTKASKEPPGSSSTGPTQHQTCTTMPPSTAATTVTTSTHTSRPLAKSNICPSRLPSKKRKGSHDSYPTSNASLAHATTQNTTTTTSSTTSVPPSKTSTEQWNSSSTAEHAAAATTSTYTTSRSRIRKDSTESSTGHYTTTTHNTTTAKPQRTFSIDLLSLSHASTVSPNNNNNNHNTTSNPARSTTQAGARKFSNDSTLPELPSSPDAAVAALTKTRRKDSLEGTPDARLPKFEELLAAPAIPDEDPPASSSTGPLRLAPSKPLSSMTSTAAVTTNPSDTALEESSLKKDEGTTKQIEDDISFGSGPKGLMDAMLLNTNTTTTDGVPAGRERQESVVSSSVLPGLQHFLEESRRDRLGSLGSASDAGEESVSGQRRERLESWGAMSDLSGALQQLGGGVSRTANSSVPGHFTMAMMMPPPPDDGEATLPEMDGLADAAAPGSTAGASTVAAGTTNQNHTSSTNPASGRFVTRDRLNSLSSASEASMTGLPMQVEGIDVTIDLQAFVSATVASMGDQLAEIAGAVELVGNLEEDAVLRRDPEDPAEGEDEEEEDDHENIQETVLDKHLAIDGSDTSSTIMRLRARSLSVNSATVGLDPEALAVAVDAANAAAATLDLAMLGRKHSFGSASSLLAMDPATTEVVVDENTTAKQEEEDVEMEEEEENVPKPKTSKRPRKRNSRSPKKNQRPSSPSSLSLRVSTRRSNRRALPLVAQRTKAGSDNSSDSEQEQPPEQYEDGVRKSSMDEREEAELRKRARAAVSARSHPLKKRVREHSNSCSTAASASTNTTSSIPLKKRVKRTSPTNLSVEDQTAVKPTACRSSSQQSTPTVLHVTPKKSNRTVAQPENVPIAPLVRSAEMPMPVATTSAPVPSKPAGGDKSTQKWESMFTSLIQFIDDRRRKDTQDLSEYEQDMWIWDGNVPTNHITVDGKKLGRWVNNQRTSKAKGSLREDRSKRLEDVGLRWSVLPANSWNETLEELRLYVEEQTKDGGEWDGNVPTSYQIKARPDGKFAGEDRNLGRWVNRQRSQYQSGKLRKDRQAALEKLGLKWSMLELTTWDKMYSLLVRYVAERKAQSGGEWDGNVPTTYKTLDDPPKALGRWINRQRTARIKKKLKPEYEEKLKKIGLRWSVHDRSNVRSKSEEMDAGGVDEVDGSPEFVVSTSMNEPKSEASTPELVGSSNANKENLESAEELDLEEITPELVGSLSVNAEQASTRTDELDGEQREPLEADRSINGSKEDDKCEETSNELTSTSVLEGNNGKTDENDDEAASKGNNPTQNVADKKNDSADKSAPALQNTTVSTSHTSKDTNAVDQSPTNTATTTPLGDSQPKVLKL